MRNSIQWILSPTSVLDKEKFNLFVRKFNLLSTEVDDEVNRLFKFDPRQAIWYSSMALLGIIYLQLPKSDP